jgi:hypothetical protein
MAISLPVVDPSEQSRPVMVNVLPHAAGKRPAHGSVKTLDPLYASL